MSTEFTCFLDLVPELRALIWEAACRNTHKPGAQFLSDGHLDVVSTYAQHSDHLLNLQAVDAPVHDPRSTYTIDWSLWNTCRESRATALRLYGDKWAEIRPGKYWDIGPGFAVSAQHAAQAQPLARPAGQLPMVVLPHQDLFVVMPSPQSRIDLINLLTLKYVIAGEKIANVGIFFDPRRTDSIRHANRCIFYNCPRVSPKVWLIYIGLHHVFGTISPDRQVFEGVGCRFTEVQPEDPGWADSAWPLDDPVHSGVREWLRVANTNWPSPVCKNCPEVHQPLRHDIGLLAYEAL